MTDSWKTLSDGLPKQKLQGLPPSLAIPASPLHSWILRGNTLAWMITHWIYIHIVPGPCEKNFIPDGGWVLTFVNIYQEVRLPSQHVIRLPTHTNTHTHTHTHTHNWSNLMQCLLWTVWGGIVKMHDLSWADYPILASTFSSHESINSTQAWILLVPIAKNDTHTHTHTHTHRLLRDWE